MKPYMAFSRENGSSEGAILVFAKTAKQAKVEAFKILSGWDMDFLDVGIVWLKEKHFFEQANKEKLNAGIPHCIESPEGCESCEKWGVDIIEKGLCEDCYEMEGEE